MENNFKTLGEYFSMNAPFVVPYYQRGYKWSIQTNEDKGKTHLEVLLDDFMNEYKNKTKEYYIQGVTVKNVENTIELVDGQQRTTSLFILLCALANKKAVFEPKILLDNKLQYKIRDVSNKVIQGFIRGEYDENNDIQDIAALNKAWNISISFVERLEDIDAFSKFLLSYVKLIYIELDANQNEIKTFSMMNQDKAIMTKTDLVKSNLLREASRQVFKNREHNSGIEWQVNHLRTKLSNEWDEWRKWWEIKSHFEFVGKTKIKGGKDVDEPNLSGLLSLYWQMHKEKEKLTQKNLYEHYKGECENDIAAIKVFEGLRKIQKSLEEWFNNYELYNLINLFFKEIEKKNVEEKLIQLLKEYTNNKKGFNDFVKDEYKKRIIFGNDEGSLTHEALQDFVKNFEIAKDVYNDKNYYYRFARQLLRMNVMRANKQKLKFDFSLYVENFEADSNPNTQMRSLEHISPQSQNNVDSSLISDETIQAITHLIGLIKRNNGDNEKSAEIVKQVFLSTEQTPDLNSIGNFVLIPKGLNSCLSDNSFTNKKEILFREMLVNDNRNYGLWLHTLEVFGTYTKWGETEIKKNKNIFLNELREFLNVGE